MMKAMELKVLTILSASAAVLLVWGVASAQSAPSEPAQPAGSEVLSEEDRNAAPIPPGRHAALVKKVCLGCHGADLVVGMRYTQEEAERFYKNMVSPDVTTDQARQIIEYLTTHLGA